MPDISWVVGGTDGTREQRFTEVFTDCYGPVLAYARRRLGPDLAQDVVEETFLTAWRRLDELSGEELPWLYRVAANSIANQRRGARRRVDLDDRARLMITDQQTADLAEEVAERSVLSTAFGSLRETDREVLRLVTWEDLDVADAASVLGCSPATFRVRLHRARRRLAASLGNEDRRSDADHPTLPLANEETL